MSAASKKDPPTNESNEGPKQLSETDDALTRVEKSFRAYASGMVMATKQAKRVAELGPAEGKASSNDKGAAERKLNEEKLKLSAETLVKFRQQVRQTVTVLEGKIRGTSKESEALHCSLRSQPCVGGRTRKRKLPAMGD